MNLAIWLARSGAAHPDRAALGFGTRVLRTYGAAAARAARLACALRERWRLAPGDRVAIAAKNCPDYLEVLYGIWHAGLAAVPANAKLHGKELAYILAHSGARAAFVTADIASEMAAHAPANVERLTTIGSAGYEALFSADPMPVVPRAPDDLAWLFYTSGTTGRPKGAMLTHRVLAWASHAYLSEVDTAAPGDALLHAAPMSHGSGLYMMPHVARAGVHVVPESGGFDAEEIARLIAVWPRTSMFAAPTMVKRMVEARADYAVENIRTIVWGGAPMYREDCLKALERFGPRLAQIYGQGESPMTISVLSRQDIADRGHANGHAKWLQRLGSAGRPFACVEVAIADAQGRVLPVGEQGEILVRGDVVMAGYWNDPEATAKTLAGGWLHTGDVGFVDADGYLTLQDRSKDLIISGGTNIYPREIEEVLLKHAKVREVSVIGRPDREWGEVVVAYVVGEAPPAELDALCLEHIARFKRPKDYVFIAALPKNAYGKILKTELRALDAKRQKSGAA
ncbi:MAG TPA: AMP-binding protein [Xanthobacteraceae bacterium]|nr:AMP-binding protein [Xanthobacteraceae bacterium]